MDTISTKIKSWMNGGRHVRLCDVDEIRRDAGFRVRNFPHLISAIAHLSFGNPHLELLYRGQNSDYRNGAMLTTLLPSIFRTANKYFTSRLAKNNFRRLKTAEQLLCKELAARSIKGVATITRHRVLQWAIIQHYGIVATPFLDVTHSLRVACSFSKSGQTDQETLLYVLGVPHLGGSVTTAADQGIQALRLLSICPPTCHRPHFQEGYLLGDYPDLSFESKKNYQKAEWDCARRLVGKFILPPANKLWAAGYEAIPDHALYPPKDPFLPIAASIKASI